MIGSALKKLAKENGMNLAQGVAYGSLRGYAATLSEGSGYKMIVFTTTFTDPAKKAELIDLLSEMNLRKQYRVLDLRITKHKIQVVFHDTIGTMKKVFAFLDWFLPLLESHTATRADVCTECGTAAVSGKWIMVDGVAYYLHESCAQRVKQQIETDNTQKKEEATGSYLLGTVGALCGAALGAVVWAVVLNLGYVASLVGLLIGWLSEKGYTLLRGRHGKAKILILILAIIFGVLLGTLAADVITLAGMISDGELPGFVMGDIPAIMLVLFAEDSQYRSATIMNVLMGLLFAGLGVFVMLKNASKAVADTKFVELK